MTQSMLNTVWNKVCEIKCVCVYGGGWGVVGVWEGGGGHSLQHVRLLHVIKGSVSGACIMQTLLVAAVQVAYKQASTTELKTGAG